MTTEGQRRSDFSRTMITERPEAVNIAFNAMIEHRLQHNLIKLVLRGAAWIK